MRYLNLLFLVIAVVTFACKPPKTEKVISLTSDTLVYHITMDKDTFLVTDTITGMIYYYDKYLETKSLNEGKNGKPEFSVTHKRQGERYYNWFKNSVLIGEYKDYTFTHEKLVENSIQIENDTGLIRFTLPDTVTKKLTILDLEVSAVYPMASGDTGWVARTKFYLLKK